MSEINYTHLIFMSVFELSLVLEKFSVGHTSLQCLKDIWIIRAWSFFGKSFPQDKKYLKLVLCHFPLVENLRMRTRNLSLLTSESPQRGWFITFRVSLLISPVTDRLKNRWKLSIANAFVRLLVLKLGRYSYFFRYSLQRKI